MTNLASARNGFVERVVFVFVLTLLLPLEAQAQEVCVKPYGWSGDASFAGEYWSAANPREEGLGDGCREYKGKSVCRPTRKAVSFASLNELIVQEPEAEMRARTVAEGRPEGGVVAARARASAGTAG